MAALALLVPLAAQSHQLQSVTVSTAVDDQGSPGTYNLVVACTGAALVYGLDLTIPYNDPGDRYGIRADSMRLGDASLEHAAYAFGNGRVDASLLGDSGLHYPLLIPRYGPLVVPIQVLDGHDGRPVRAVLDVTYVGNPGTQCGAAGLYGPQKIGFVGRSDAGGSHIDRHVLASVQMSVRDFNAYLKSIGEQWSLDLVVKDDQSRPEAALEKVKELDGEGVSLIVGPPSSGSLAAILDYTRFADMLVVSCCSTATSLALPDHVFRTAPDDTNQARALARLMADDGVSVAVVAYRDDPYGRDLGAVLAVEMTANGGAVGSAIAYPAMEPDFGDLSQKVADEVRIMAEVNGPGAVAVVFVGFGEVADMVRASIPHDILGGVRWYGSEAVVKLRSITQGDLGAFSGAVNMSGVAVSVVASQLNDDLSLRLAEELDLPPGQSPNPFSYSAYDAVLILGRTMLATQGADTATLVAALPDVAPMTYGALYNNTLNENGDLASSDYGVWRVVGDEWVRTGTFVHATDSIDRR